MIYATEIVRGLDVLALTPSEFLSENELVAATLADTGTLFNPQQQYRATWPNAPVVARAYRDQLQRANVLSDEQAEALTALLDRADTPRDADATDATLSDEIEALAAAMTAHASNENGVARTRLTRLAQLLEGIR